jgi:prepilin-type N-terminal cleavage/methylation domain-containing protein
MKTNDLKNDGFTLIEMILTVVILGVIAGMALPQFSLAIERTKSAEGVRALTTLLTAQKLYFQENGAYTATYADLDITIDTLSNFDSPLTDANIFSTPAKVAALNRVEGATTLYTLCIDENAVISCRNGTITVCARFRFPSGCL